MPVQIVVAKSHAHSRLFRSIVAQGHAPDHTLFPKSSAVIVYEEQAGSGVAGYVDVRPAVFVQIGCNDGHAVAFGGAGHASLLTYVGEGSVAIVAVQAVSPRGQPARSAFHRNTF